MIIREFIQEDKAIFFVLNRMFYETNVTKRSYDEGIAEKTFSRVMGHHENLWGYLFVDKDRKQPIGYALITSYWCNEEGGEVVLLDEIFLNPIDRHKGYAEIFMRWLEEHFSFATALSLEVLPDNERAIHFYKKVGFSPDGYISYDKKIEKR